MIRPEMPKFTVSRIAVVGGAVGILSAVLAGAQAAALPHRQPAERVQIIRLVECIAAQPVVDDGGAPGAGVGDRLIFSADLFDQRDRAVGRDRADCVVVRIDRLRPAATQQVVECMVTVELEDGQITFQGLAQGTDSRFAVTGGTGAYQGACGEAHVVDRVPLREADTRSSDSVAMIRSMQRGPTSSRRRDSLRRPGAPSSSVSRWGGALAIRAAAEDAHSDMGLVDA